MRSHYRDQHPSTSLPQFIEKKERINNEITIENVRFNAKTKSSDILQSVMDSNADVEPIELLGKTITDYESKC